MEDEKVLSAGDLAETVKNEATVADSAENAPVETCAKEECCECCKEHAEAKKGISLGSIFTIVISAVYLLPFMITMLFGFGMFANSEYIVAFSSTYPDTVGDFFSIFKGGFSFSTILMLISIIGAVLAIVFTSISMVKKEDNCKLVVYFGLGAFVFAFANFLVLLLKDVKSVDDLVGNLISMLSKGEIRLMLIALFVFLVPVITKPKKA